MSIAAKTGFVADFKIGYLQHAIIEHLTEVTGGTDVSFDAKVTGYAVSRLVKLNRLADGSAVLVAPTGVTASSIGDATHIVAQSDDSLRNVPGDVIPVERLVTRNRDILGNTASTVPAAISATMKSIALYRITNVDDIKIIPIAPATVSVTR